MLFPDDLEHLAVLSEQIDVQRRRFLRTSALAFAGAAGLGLIGSMGAVSATPALAAAPAGFGPIKQIDAGDLNVGERLPSHRAISARLRHDDVPVE